MTGGTPGGKFGGAFAKATSLNTWIHRTIVINTVMSNVSNIGCIYTRERTLQNRHKQEYFIAKIEMFGLNISQNVSKLFAALLAEFIR